MATQQDQMEKRIAGDNVAYVFAEFVEHYADRAQEKWDEATPCTAPTSAPVVHSQAALPASLPRTLPPTGSLVHSQAALAASSSSASVVLNQPTEPRHQHIGVLNPS